MSNPRIRVKVDGTAQRGAPLRVKTLMMHHMETGLRRDARGNAIARHIINRFVCKLGDETLFDAEVGPAVAANPYFEFTIVPLGSGTLSFHWFEDGGHVYTAERRIDVT